jgi:PIN domain nuclease of toxin-antitoxin system
MRLLVDTQALLWFVDQDANLSPAARTAMIDPANELLLSAATIWEVAIKVGIGKLKLSGPYETFMSQAVALLRLNILPVEVRYAVLLTTLPRHHGDPFDRLMVAQAIVEKVPIISSDVAFDAYPVTRLW